MSAGDVRLCLRVAVAEQRIALLRGAEVVWRAPVSTSRFGLGVEEGSYKTPTGRFRIAEKIGADAPLGARFVSRAPSGEVWPRDDDPAADWILTRILWLEGLDPANANTRARYIYLHGTNHEDELGTPASHGCIRLGNAEIVGLFERVEVGTPVEIAG